MARESGWATVLALAALMGTPACGGSSGGGGGGSGGGVTVALDTDRFAIRGDEGSSPSVLVTARISGQTSAQVYVSAVDEGQAIARVEAQVGATAAALFVYARSTLAPGSYSGTLVVNACYDQACGTHVRGSPFRLQYTVEILPIFKVSPLQVALSAVSGTGVSAPITVQLPYGTSAFQVSNLPGWAKVESQTASGFTLALASVPSGSYSDDVYVSAGGSQRTIHVTYTVAEAPGGRHDLALDTSSLQLAAVEAADVTAHLGVTPPSWNPPLWTSITYGSGGTGWLSATATAGGYDLRADASALAQGTYRAWFSVLGDVYTTAKGVTVDLTVGPALVTPADQALAVTATSGPAALQGSVTVSVAGGPPRAWTATTDAAWLTLDTGSGMTGTPLVFRVTPEALAAVKNGSTPAATVRVAADPSRITPVHFAVTLAKRLPEVTSVGPGVILSGRAHRVLARGVGFAGLADVSAGVTVDGLAGVGVTRVGDTELALDLPAAVAGDYSIRASNALSSPVAAAQVRVVDAPALAYARLQSTGVKRRVVYDPLHQAVWASTAGGVLRWGYAAGAWTAASQAVADLRDVALTPDAGALVAVSYTGALRLLDPVTLVEEAKYDRGGPLGPANLSGDGVAVTNDRRVWLPFGDGGWSKLGVFDLADRTFSQIPTSNDFYEGPRLAASGNGERLLVDGRFLDLHLDAADGTLKPGCPSFNWGLTSDEAGSRFLAVGTSGAALFDASLASAGSCAMPASYVQYKGGMTVAAVVSPDGSRAYAELQHGDARPGEGLGVRHDRDRHPAAPRLLRAPRVSDGARRLHVPQLRGRDGDHAGRGRAAHRGRRRGHGRPGAVDAHRAVRPEPLARPAPYAPLGRWSVQASYPRRASGFFLATDRSFNAASDGRRALVSHA